MKLAYPKYVYALTGIILTLISCKKMNELTDPHKELIVYAKYSYPTGGVPQLTIDYEQSSKALKSQQGLLETEFDTLQKPNRAFVSIKNFRLRDELGTYQIIDEIQVEEQKAEDYEPDPENFLHSQSNISFDFVLVLDQSTSLGSDISTVRNLAKDFISKITVSNANSKVGVVVFSHSITSHPLAPPSDQTYAFIDQSTPDNETRLYEAIDKGVELLSTSNAEGKAIVVFTDGKNNGWSDFAKYSTHDYVKAHLIDKNISTFCIGLENRGGIDKDILLSLAESNGGLADFTNDISALGRIFDKFAGSVSAVYKLTYDRNASRFDTPRNIRFRFKTKIL